CYGIDAVAQQPPVGRDAARARKAAADADDGDRFHHGVVASTGPPGEAASRRASSSAFAVGAFTFQASPTACKLRMSMALRSSCHQCSPVMAEYGKAWWLLCQPSPNEGMATQKLLRLWSGAL